MDGKKISFGFSKINKKPNILPTKNKEKEETKVELIKCFEGQEIKLVEEKVEAPPLIIPMKENVITPAALASLKKRRAVLLDEDLQETVAEDKEKQSNGEVEKEKVEETDLDKRAALELLATSNGTNTEDNIDSNVVVPIVKADDLPLDGAKQSTLDDYENIPVEQFGFAMLRGMGWVEPPKKKDGPPKDEIPNVRPKGMGLGADKAIKPKPLLVAPEKNEILEIKKQAYVRILAGKHKDLYGQIEGFDDDSSRVIVKMAIGGAKQTFNEFLCQPVSKNEYAQYGKCINSTKYDEYKKKEKELYPLVFDRDGKGEDDDKVAVKREFKDEEKDYKRKEIKEEYYDEKYRNSESSREFKRIKTEDERKYNRHDDFSKDRDYKSSKSERNYSRDPEDKRDYRDKYESSRRKDYSRRDDDDDEYSRPSSSKISSSQKDRDDYSSKSRKNRPSSPKPSSSDDSASSEDSDSAYEQSQKKSKHKSRSKKKSKKSKNKKHRKASTSEDSSSDSYSSSEEDRKRKKSNKHKKKTKKSKRERSRSRSRGRR